jgi:predicted enzyme related to lactoylglutathione lyase
MPDADEPRDEGRRRHFAHGQLTYLQIPATEPMRSADFYEAVFGWRIERPHPSFESPGLIGQWVADRPAAPEAGPLLWINVDDLSATLSAARAHGGEVRSEPEPDGPTRLLATIRDPGGTTVGLVQLLPEP